MMGGSYHERHEQGGIGMPCTEDLPDSRHYRYSKENFTPTETLFTKGQTRSTKLATGLDFSWNMFSIHNIDYSRKKRRSEGI